jgi:carbon-monoxide dehydrogenase small subunit
MIARFTLDGSEVAIECDEDDKLLSLLRDKLGLKMTKHACGEGHCGLCVALLDGRPVQACLVPAFKLDGRSVLSYEGFCKLKAHASVAEAFAKAGCKPCPLCAGAKELIAYGIILKTQRPSDDDIRKAFMGHYCPCTASSALEEAVKLAAYILASKEGRHGR